MNIAVKSPNNIRKLKQHIHQETVSSTLLALEQADILDNQRINSLLDPEYSILLTPLAEQYIWKRLPTELLTSHWEFILAQVRTQLFINRINQIPLEHPEAYFLLENLTIYILAMLQSPDATFCQINANQSTHTTSVHQSVSHSAIRLFKRYGHLIENNDLAVQLFKIKSFVHSLPQDKIEYQAAKNCM